MSYRTINKCLFLLIMVFSARSIFAQAATGTIYGTVLDRSNAIIPNATIKVTNTGTNISRVLKADNSGQFNAPLLPAGLYKVEVESAGFNVFLQENIVLSADITVQVTANLQIQGLNQSVTVSSSAELLQTQQTSLTEVVDERQINDLPLNGRNVLELMGINNGVSFNGTRNGGVIIETQTFGNGSYAVPVSVNGSRPNQTNYLYDDQDNNDGFQNVNEPFPNPDAVKEFTMQTSTFDAQYGRGVGGLVNVITKSGTNEFHGTAFDFLRNYDLNAKNYFSGLDSLKRNQFGGSFGGPILRDRTFFFGSYQGTRQSSATPGAIQGNAPTAAMEMGDLSAFRGKDANGNPVDNIIDPLTGKPFPDNIIPQSRWDPVSTKLLAYLPPANRPNRQYQYATPPNIFHDNQLIFRGDHKLSDKQQFYGRYFYLNNNIPFGEIPLNLYYITLGQRGTIQSLAFGDTYIFTPKILNQVGIGYHRETPQAKTPAIQESYTSLGANILQGAAPSLILGVGDVGGFLWNGLGYFTQQQTYQINDNVSISSGKHTIKVGGEIKKYREDIDSYFLSGGWAQFNGGLTSIPGQQTPGNAFAEFLLGDLSNWQQQSYWSERIYQWFYTLYVQDDLRLTKKLTFNAGLRWEPRPAYTERSGKETTFIPGKQSHRYPNAPLGIVFSGDPGVGSNVIADRYWNLAPRAGLAFQISPTTVARAAYGIFYDQQITGDNNSLASNPPFVAKATCGPCSGPLSNPLGSAPPFVPEPIAAGPDYQFPAYNNFTVPGHFAVTPYVQSWNVTVEQQLAANDLLRLSYVGNAASHLYDAVQTNIPSYIPGQSFGYNENQRRPYQPIGSLTVIESIGTAHYHALDVAYTHRYSHGIGMQANYTWGKSIDTASQEAGLACPYNLKACQGRSDFDIANRFVLSGNFQHPEFKHSNLFMRELIGGWQSNVIWTAQSGSPFSVFCYDDNSLSGVGADFCDRVPGVSPRLAHPTKDLWYDPAAYQPNAIGTYGNSGRNNVVGPHYWNVDYSLFKTFALEKVSFQLRGEAFNIFNHTNLGGPSNALFSSPGVIGSAGPPRILQVAGKLIF